MCFSRRDQFLASCLRQYFDLPDSMIYYIAKNPKSSIVYQKLIQSCKYFFIKNPILVFHCLSINNDGWTTCSDDCRAAVFTKKANVNKETLSGCKLWIQNKLRIYSTNSNYASDLIPDIFQCDAEKLLMTDQKLSLQELKFFSNNLKRCFMEKVMVYSDADSKMPAEEIIANLPTIEKISLVIEPSSISVSSDTVMKLLQIPHFKNMNEIELYKISEEFDIETFYNYFKNTNTNLTFIFKYQNLPSEDYAQKLEEIISEILLRRYDDRLTPLISYPGQDASKKETLFEMYEKMYPLFDN